jgi:hypothetical protein
MGFGSGEPIRTNQDEGQNKRGKDQKISVTNILTFKTVASMSTPTSARVYLHAFDVLPIAHSRPHEKSQHNRLKKELSSYPLPSPSSTRFRWSGRSVMMPSTP